MSGETLTRGELEMTSRIIGYVEGMSYGRGYNRLTGEAMPSPAVVGETAKIKNAEGQRVTTSCRITTDVKTLHESLGIDIEAGGSYMGFSGSAKVQYAEQCDFSSFSTYIVVKVTVTNAFEDIQDPKFHQDAEELIEANNTVRFRERFGDCFISGLRTGGEYFAIYQLTSTSEAKKTSLAIDVEASYQGGLASAELRSRIQTARESTEDHVDTKVYVYREGSVRTADITAEDIMETARQFPVEVGTGEAFVYGAMLQDYKALKNPNDAFDYYQIEAQRQALKELAEVRFQFLGLRDDISYILKRSDDFVNADGSDVDRGALSADFESVVAAINDMQHKMSEYSRDAGKAELPRYDTGTVRLPVLRPRPGIPVPSFVGLRLVAVEVALRDTLREYADYCTEILAASEPGTSGLPMSAEQYACVVGGPKVVWSPPLPTHLSNHYLRWIVSQDPAAGGDVATAEPVTLRWKAGTRFPG